MTSEWMWVGATYALTWVVLGSYATLTLRRRKRAADELEAAGTQTRQRSETQS
jgi:hypothetical protein